MIFKGEYLFDTLCVPTWHSFCTLTGDRGRSFIIEVLSTHVNSLITKTYTNKKIHDYDTLPIHGEAAGVADDALEHVFGGASKMDQNGVKGSERRSMKKML